MISSWDRDGQCGRSQRSLALKIVLRWVDRPCHRQMEFSDSIKRGAFTVDLELRCHITRAVDLGEKLSRRKAFGELEKNT